MVKWQDGLSIKAQSWQWVSGMVSKIPATKMDQQQTSNLDKPFTTYNLLTGTNTWLP